MNIFHKIINKAFPACLVLNLLLLISCQTGINRFKNGQRHGLWVVYTDSTKTRISEKGRYRDGEQVGKWIYNTDDGEPFRTVQYSGTKIKIRGYYPDHKIAERGQARIVSENGKLHFYYCGKWKYYAHDGSLQKTTEYEKGKIVRDIFPLTNTKDSSRQLRLLLKKIESDFDIQTRRLNEAQQEYGINSKEYLLRKTEKIKNDSVLYAKIDSIIRKNGYPAKSQVGDENEIIFYIISFAKWEIKEKYLSCFTLAAQRGDISEKDLAYFEDKLAVAKYGYQIYGTQGVFDKNYKLIYYPVKNLTGMNERRKEKGFDPVDLSLYTEKAQ